MILLVVLAISLANTTPKLKVQGIVTSSFSKNPIADVNVNLKGSNVWTKTNINGEFEISTPTSGVLIFTKNGYLTKKVSFSGQTWLEVEMEEKVLKEADEITDLKMAIAPGYDHRVKKSSIMGYGAYSTPGRDADSYQNWNTESYSTIHENIFHNPLNKPLSTFSIDVDVASYSNIRRYLNNGQRPPKDAVRIEEMINYFSYDYSGPSDDQPFAVHWEVAQSPWNKTNKLMMVGLQGRRIPKEELPPSNLVFLLDVSGSMNQFNKLPLLKSAFKMLVGELRPEDRVAIVVYAGAAGVVLPSTSGDQKTTINNTLDRLNAGGSTAGGAGIRLAYNIAAENYIEGGNNRVILATDGDFNIGESSDAAMERLIEEKKEKGVFLTVLGFGMGNYKDSKMEILADKGNGNYAYIDTMKEAEKVLKKEFGGTLFTIAKDVKIQIEFNPKYVKSYRLIGYENRVLQDEDFNNDKKDAGDLGAGHSVTALYEIVPTGTDGGDAGSIDPLKYQKKNTKKNFGGEMATVKLRYKQPDENSSNLLTTIVKMGTSDLEDTSNNLRWATAVAAFGMILRDSEYIGKYDLNDVTILAKSALGKDLNGYRHEFIQLVGTSTVFASN